MAINGKGLVVSAAKRKSFTLGSFSGGVGFSTDESVLPLKNAKDCYNFDFSDGTLKNGYGTVTFDVFDFPVKNLWMFRRYDSASETYGDMILAVGSDGLIHYCRVGDDSVGTLSHTPFVGDVQFVNYRLNGDDVVIASSESDDMLVWNGVDEPYTVSSAPHITSMALHYERLFVTTDGEKNSVWFSDDLDPTNWDASLTGGGFIQLVDERGASNRVISYLGYLYVFRDYGVSRITAYGSQSEFSVSNMFVSSGKIYPQSVALCGDLVVFLADDGLYSFDGVSTTRIFANLDGLIESGENACAGYYGGKYYLAFRRTADGETVGCEAGEYVNNALLVFDVNKGTYALSRGIDIGKLCPVSGYAMLAVKRNGSSVKIEKTGADEGAALKKSWVIPKTDLGETRRKRLREIYITSAHSCTLTAFSDEGERSVSVAGTADVQRKRLNFLGRRIGLKIECDGDADISRPTLVFTVGGF